MSTKALDNCTRVPISEITSPKGKGIVEVYENFYWVVIDECVLMYKGLMPQCNLHKDLSYRLMRELYPDAECRLLEIAFVPYVE